jgi:rRNA processing protein Krr1/Pno1
MSSEDFSTTSSVLGKRRADEETSRLDPPAKRDSYHEENSLKSDSSNVRDSSATGDVTCTMSLPQTDGKGNHFNSQNVLVGPEGSNQKAFETETGCRLVFKDKDGEDSNPSEGISECIQLVLHGSSEEVVMKGEEVLLRIFADQDVILEIKKKQMRATVNSGSDAAPSTTFSSNSNSESAESSTPKYIEAFHIPSGAVGSVIGRGGETIREIQQKSGAHVKIQPQQEVQVGSTSRLVTITGTPATVAEAKKLVNELVHTSQSNQSPSGSSHSSSFHSNGGGSGSGGFAPRGPPAPSPGGPSATVQVPDDRVGAIIGRGGQTIKMLQDRTGARIQVPKEGVNGFRPVLISAPSSDQIQHAYREIQMLLAQEPGKSALGGSSFGGGYGGHGLGGGGGGGHGAPWGRSDRASGGVGISVGGGVGGPEQTLSIPIQGDRAGAVIGKQGQTIRLLQDRSGCKVSCPGAKDGVPNDGPRNVIIVGPASGVEIARNDINLILTSTPGTPIMSILGNAPGGSGGGGGGGGGGRSFGSGGGGGYPSQHGGGGGGYPASSNPYGASGAFGSGVSSSAYSSGAYSSAYSQMQPHSQLYHGGGGGGGGGGLSQSSSHGGHASSGGGDMASWAAYNAAMQVYNARQPLDRTH